MQKQSAFSLIEAMVVVAIVGILASIAMPTYSGYLAKAKKAEIAVIADRFKTGITEYYLDNATFPTTEQIPEVMLFANKSKYVETVEINSDGGFVITGKSSEFGAEYSLGFKPLIEYGVISWDQL